MSAYEDNRWIWIMVLMVGILAAAIMFKSELGVLAMVFTIAAYMIFTAYKRERQRDLRSVGS